MQGKPTARPPRRRSRRFNPLGPCGGHARPGGPRPRGDEVQLVSIPSAPAGGMQVDISKAETVAHRAEGFNPLGPCGGHASGGAYGPIRSSGPAVHVSIPSAPAGGMQDRHRLGALVYGGHARFNPLGPCGGHARDPKRARASKATVSPAFQSPRPLRGACKVTRLPFEPTGKRQVSIPSAPAGGMQGAGVRHRPRNRLHVSIPSAPAGGMQASPTECTHRPPTKRSFQSPRPLRGACKWPGPGCRTTASTFQRFNPLGPCGTLQGRPPLHHGRESGLTVWFNPLTAPA